MNEPKPSLYDKLISRLEGSLAGISTPVSDGFRQTPYNNLGPGCELDQGHIFDPASLQQMILPTSSEQMGLLQ